MDFLVNLTLDILNFLQALTGFSDVFMGMTILGISNSCVDLFINMALSDQGYEIMAVTGLFAGQMFNFLTSLGVSFVLKYFTAKKASNFILFTLDGIKTDREQLMTFVIVSAALVILVSLYVRLPLLK